ncbi:hypothetical protein P7C71_g1903, partial [Lecanoromycetidae sp. Uapishka_2]
MSDSRDDFTAVLSWSHPQQVENEASSSIVAQIDPFNSQARDAFQLFLEGRREKSRERTTAQQKFRYIQWLTSPLEKGLPASDMKKRSWVRNSFEFQQNKLWRLPSHQSKVGAERREVITEDQIFDTVSLAHNSIGHAGLEATAKKIASTSHSAAPLENLPPFYTTDTPTSNSDPPLSSILKPCHSTKASRLAYATSQGRYTTLEYSELTFSIMVMVHKLRAPVVVAIDEDIDILIGDLQRMFYNGLNNKELTELSIEWGRTAEGRDFGPGLKLTNLNATAMLRLLKSRGGQDTISAR